MTLPNVASRQYFHVCRFGTLVIAARSEKEGKETVQLVKEAGSEGIFVRTDVTNEDDVRPLVERTVKEYGGLDYALNNAGFDEAETSLVEETSRNCYCLKYKR